LSNTLGNGAFIEVMDFIDGIIVGVVWPLPIIYTRGINALFWHPVTGIGTFDLPSYEIEVTQRRAIGTWNSHLDELLRIMYDQNIGLLRAPGNDMSDETSWGK